MSVMLINGKREVYTYGVWDHILRLGKSYGWKPHETMLFYWENEEGSQFERRPADGPADEKGQWVADYGWNGSYTMKAGQMISRKDSWALAMVLKTAREDLPDHFVGLRDEDLSSIPLKMFQASELEYEDQALICRILLAFFTRPKDRKILDKIIELMKNGPCFIY